MEAAQLWVAKNLRSPILPVNPLPLQLKVIQRGEAGLKKLRIIAE